MNSNANNPRSHARAALLVLAVAATYMVTGKLGLMLAIPPGYATAIFPASGIALAATLLWGLRGSVGAWLGSFTMNLWTGLAAGSELSLAAMFVPSCIATGALFQSQFGAALVRRVIGFPNPLDRERDIALFMVLGGAVGCIVSATFGVTALWFVGTVTDNHYLANWGNWWLGDTIGVIIATPIALTLFARPRRDWARRRVVLVATMGVMLLIVVSIYIMASKWEAHRIAADFRNAARQTSYSLQQELTRQADVLDSIARFYGSSNFVDADEFHQFTAPIVRRDPVIQALEWVPRITAGARADFETHVRQSGYPQFAIRDRESSGRLVPAQQRDEYFPVTYIEPFGANEGAHGFDVGSEPTRRAAIDRAIATGEPHASERVLLLQGSSHGGDLGVLMFYPIYKGDHAREASSDRKPYGLALGIVNLREMVSGILGSNDLAQFNFELHDMDADDEHRVLFSSPSASVSANTALNYEQRVEFGARTWKARFTPTPAFMDKQSTWQAWIVLACGLIMTGLLESYLLLVTGRSSRVERLVEDRTRDLESANRNVLEHDRLLAAISRVQEMFIRSGDAPQLYALALNEAVALSKSQYGVIGVVMYRNSGEPYVKAIAFSDLSSNPEYADFYHKFAAAGMETSSLKSLLGEVIKTGAPVIANDPRTDARGGTPPPGHPELRSYLGAPLKQGNATIGVIGLANRSGGYDAASVEYVEPLLRTIANVVEATVNAQRRRETERALAANQELLRAAQRIAHVGHWDWDTRTNELTWSDETYRINGLEPGAIKPTYAYFVDTIHPDDRARVLADIQATLVTAQPYHLEFRVMRPDASVRWILGAGELQRDESGVPLRMVGIVLDITDRKISERDLENARDEADRANRAKSEFLSNMSHELRTPMNAILGYAQLLSYDAGLGEKNRSQLAHIQQAGEHLLNLINDVLDFSRIEAGSMSVFHEDIELGAVLREVKSLIKPAAKARQVSVSIHDDSGANVMVRADRTRLKQVILNLLSNAVKYNRVNGTVEVYCTVSAGSVRISVRDTGAGISTELQQQLFQPFNRLGQERGEVEGTGIGLVITRRLIELMGGALGFDSRAGTGSTFWIDMACTIRTAQPDETLSASEMAKHLKSRDLKRSVLYVEDNPANMDIVRSVITTFWPNAEFIEAITAEIGVALAVLKKPDLILMDINLPGIDGYEALKRLQMSGETLDTPVYALTANALPADVQRGIDAGFSGYLTKPLDVPQFIRLVDEIFANPAAAKHAVVSASRRVLVVDDDAVNVEVLRTMVSALGYDVETCSDGQSALAKLRQVGYGLVFMDCEMPVMNGYHATRAARQLPAPIGTLPIIAVSANAPGEDAAAREQAGFTDVMPKPVDLETLRGMLTRYLNCADPAPEPVAAAERHSAVNIRVLDQLRQLLGSKTAQVVDSLLTDVPSRLERMRNAIAANDYETARREAHTMKGSSSNLGAVTFSQLCALINDACKNGITHDLPAMCAQAAQEFESHVLPALSEFKKSLAE